MSTQRGEQQTHVFPAETHSRSALRGGQSLCCGTRTCPAASRASAAEELLGTSPAKGDLSITPAHVMTALSGSREEKCAFKPISNRVQHLPSRSVGAERGCSPLSVPVPSRSWPSAQHGAVWGSWQQRGAGSHHKHQLKPTPIRTGTHVGQALPEPCFTEQNALAKAVLDGVSHLDLV